MFRCENQVGGAKKGIGAGGENVENTAAGQREPDFRALAAADPVALEKFDGFGPVEQVEVLQEALGVGGYAEHPLFEGTANDFVAFGAPFFDFFVGKHCAEVGRPVDRGFGDVGQPAGVDLFAAQAGIGEFFDRAGALCFFAVVGVVDLKENPLGPFDVAGVCGADFTVPIVGEAQGLELGAEGGDVFFCGDAGMLSGLDGVLFCRQAEGVPAHGMEDVFSVHTMVAGKDVGCCVAFGVPDVQSGAGGVGEHVQDVVFLFGGIEVGVAGVGGAECFVLVPIILPFFFNDVMRVGFASECGGFRCHDGGVLARGVLINKNAVAALQDGCGAAKVA